MKKIFTLFFVLLAKSSFAITCTMTTPTLAFGTITSFPASTSNTVNISCVGSWSNTTLGGYLKDNATGTNTLALVNGANNLYGDFSFMGTAGGANYVICSSQIQGGYCTAEFTIPSRGSLPAGAYSGTFPVTIKDSNGTTTVGSGNIIVTATLPATCSWGTTSGIAFGTVPGSSQTLTNANISSTCSNGTSYTISADGGVSANISARTLKYSTNTLPYQLYTNSGYSTVWGNGTTGSTIALTGTGSAQTTTVYGKIVAGNYPPAGSYSDTVNLTITY